MKKVTRMPRLNLSGWDGAGLMAVWFASVLGATCLGAQPLALGTRAPSFELKGLFGERYSLETFKGHILVMQFGTSW